MQEKRLRHLGGMMIEESKNTEPGFLLFYRVASYEVVLVNEFPQGYKVLLRRSPGLCLPMMDKLFLFFAIIRIDGLV